MTVLGLGDILPEAITNQTYIDSHDTPRHLTTRGNPRVLSIYKSSCQASKTMFPFLERLQSAYGDTVEVLGVSQDSPNVTRSFARRTDVTFPILIEPNEFPISRAFAITETPTVFVVNLTGEITYQTAGFSRNAIADLSAAVATLTGREPAPLIHTDDEVPERVPG